MIRADRRGPVADSNTSGHSNIHRRHPIKYKIFQTAAAIVIASGLAVPALADGEHIAPKRSDRKQRRFTPKN
ncbi:MAG: hypothetical protein VW547_04145 [Alphaproteobacteria bacterium]